MAYSTKPVVTTLFQLSVALALFFSVCMARNFVNTELDLSKLGKPASSKLIELPALSPSTEPADSKPNTSGCSKTYKVKEGETCYSTWTRFKVQEKTFYSLNPGIDCDNLDIGQALCIGGDTGASISSDLPAPGQSGLSDSSEMPGLSPSTEPAESEPNTSGCSKTYKVKKGETCYSTWKKFNVKEKTFYALNPGIHCDSLDIGQALCVGGGAN